ncbi:hypothetical protein QQ045_002683 [Rhodiola kirilowii]
MSDRDTDSCSSLITLHARRGNFHIAFRLFTEMVHESQMPDEVAVASLIRSSGNSLEGKVLGLQLHGWVLCSGLGFSRNVRAALIFMYSCYENLDDARRVFDEVHVGAAESLEWDSIVAAYVRWGCWTNAFVLFSKLLYLGMILPTVMTYASIVSACGSAREGNYCAMVLGRLIKDGPELDHATMLWNTVVTMYSKLGNPKDAKKVFEKISRKDVVSWNAVIAAHEHNGDEASALVLFRRMIREKEALQPNRITFLSIISALSAVSGLKQGREMHAHVVRLGLDSNGSVANALINLYSKCRRVEDAKKIFDKQLLNDAISWNSMLSGYQQNEQVENCFGLFNLLLESGVKPDSHSFTIILTASTRNPLNVSFLKICSAVHGYFLKTYSPAESSVSIQNALVTAYGRFRCVVDAEKIFDRMSKKDTFTWNAKMDAYSSNSLFEEALGTFTDMLQLDVQFDQSSFSIILSACGRSVSLENGKQLHAIILKLVNHRDLAHSNSLLSVYNSLLSMYSKCGEIDDAARVFNMMQKTDVFTWTAMITAYAYHGMATRSLQLYQKMLNTGVQPNHVTFLGVLTACAHSGLIDDGVRLFNSMSHDHGLSPGIEHYACLVDLYSRSGQFDLAKSVIQSAISIFGTNIAGTADLHRVLLGACHARNELDLGISTASMILELEPNDEATHVLLANLFAASGLWDDAIRMRKAMERKGLSKEVGCSWMVIGKTSHVFVSGGISHPQRKDIYDKLKELNFRAKGMVMSQ